MPRCSRPKVLDRDKFRKIVFFFISLLGDVNEHKDPMNNTNTLQNGLKPYKKRGFLVLIYGKIEFMNMN